ncbi:DUF7527 domain-containing protein [Halodesulfurarchaeum sp.]|uniref:DUF7527 domain-containing protein n=1 Tax=Halodesulfurarchaeum sp. TaxID=1980530 RepID=UPI002FC3CE3C
MHSRTVDQVQSWDSRPFSGGLEALSSLSEADHTGAVVADDTWLFMLNGRVIGLFEGMMDDFEAEGTVYTTSRESLPLLFSMQEREGRTRAKYFTEDTPLNEADKTLADANFTGYIELSENVLSGDYYLVYYGGTRRSAAFIGQSERVETGDEAFEKAAEEVGLYEVKDVSMTITEIPEPSRKATETAATDDEETAATVPAATGEGKPAAESPATEPTESEPQANQPEEPEVSAKESDQEAAGKATETTAESHIEEVTEDTGATETTRKTEQSNRTAERALEDDTGSSEATEKAPETTGKSTGAETAGETTPEGPGETPTQPGRQTEPAGTSSEVPEEGSGVAPTDQPPDADRKAVSDESTVRDSEEDVSDSELERMFRAEAEWRQTRSIPALDPDETESTEAPTDRPKTGSAPKTGSSDSSPTQRQTSSQETTSQRTQETKRSRSKSSATNSGPKEKSRSTASGSRSDGEIARSGSKERVQKLETAVKKRNARIETLETRLEDMDSQRSELETDLETERAERNELESALETIRKERNRLETRVEELEAAAERDGSTAAADTNSLAPEEAMAGTNLFVRYESKGDPTLEALGDGVDQAAVNGNLQLEHHTQFETDAAKVDGQPFREFLEATGSYRFVSWLLHELPFELLETGSRNSLSDLFEAISDIDRIEFDGTVTVEAEPGSDQHFAIVMRDRMGNPLIVGEYNDDRNPVKGSELDALLDGARDVAGSVDSLAGAFFVTASFFEPAALETAEDAASKGGLFSRQEKASYVAPDRGSGFHLGLVEDRSQAFHVTVPKL